MKLTQTKSNSGLFDRHKDVIAVGKNMSVVHKVWEAKAPEQTPPHDQMGLCL